MSKKILITSALPYVNNVPHLGTMVCILSADAYTRFLKLRGEDALFVCGTDEHGTTTETKALEEGTSPKDVCDKYSKIHKEVYDWFECDFDCWGRTSDKENHARTQDIFLKLQKNGFIFDEDVDQTYCEKDKRFLADRFVEGTCPHCNYEDARGDQCESCGKLLNAIELKDPRCKMCGGTPIVKTSRHLFLDLPKLQPEIQKFVETRSDVWSTNAKTMSDAWLKEGLKPRCITRDIKWGVDVPMDGFSDKVFYVWFDAPIGYISITEHVRKDWADWWMKPDEVENVMFMGKDNIPFHTIMFPSFLMGTRDNYKLMDRISSNEYLNYEDSKFSKSRGTGVFGDDAMSTGLIPDVWRYYILVNRPESSDTVFTWRDFQEKNNNELLANLGNFVNRTLTFLKNNFNGKLPEANLTDADDAFFRSVDATISEYITRVMDIDLKDGLKKAMHVSRLGNQYFQENQPWKLVKGSEEEKKRCGTVMAVCANLVRVLSILVEPYMPGIAAEIRSQLNISEHPQEQFKLHLSLKVGHTIGTPKPLFRKLEDKEMEEFKEKFAGKKTSKADGPTTAKNVEIKEGVFPLDLRVGKIISVSNHPDADKLYVLQIDIGSERRQLVAGLKSYYPPEELKDRKIVIVCNLKPAKLRGVESQGMLLAADENDGKVVKLLDVPESDVGTSVLPEVAEVDNKNQLDHKAFSKLKLSIGDEGTAMFNDHPLKAGDEKVTAKIGNGAKIR